MQHYEDEIDKIAHCVAMPFRMQHVLTLPSWRQTKVEHLVGLMNTASFGAKNTKKKQKKTGQKNTRETTLKQRKNLKKMKNYVSDVGIS